MGELSIRVQEPTDYEGTGVHLQKVPTDYPGKMEMDWLTIKQKGLTGYKGKKGQTCTKVAVRLKETSCHAKWDQVAVRLKGDNWMSH